MSVLKDHHVQFKIARSKARAEVRRVKNRWRADLASQAEVGRKAYHGTSVWTAIRSIQRSFSGLHRSPSAAVRDEAGLLCASQEAQIGR